MKEENIIQGAKSSNHKECIENVPIFSTLDKDELYEVIMVSKHKKMKKGEILYGDGDHVEKLYIVNRGKVKITKVTREGKEQIIRILGEGDFTGELSLFSAQKVKNNAEALMETDICMIDGDTIKELMLKKTTIAVKILSELAKRLEKTEDLIETIGLQDVDEKVASVLLSLAKEDVVELGISKKDLAAHIQVSPETLSRKLSKFEEMGIIRQESTRRIVITDREALEIMQK
ncbi:MAG: Crp/Fnr family transcriptional regulator [Clostridiaceae bacterium]